MSNYNSLKATIDANIKQNGNQEITGQILNSVLNAMVTTLGAEYQFAGVATIDTNPGTPDAKVFYIANGKGTYTNFGSLEVTEDEVVVLYWDTEWHKVATGIASQAKLSELEQIVTKTHYEEKTLELVVDKGYYRYDTGAYDTGRANVVFQYLSSYNKIKISTQTRIVTLAGVIYLNSDIVPKSTIPMDKIIGYDLVGNGTNQYFTDYELTIPEGTKYILVQSTEPDVIPVVKVFESVKEVTFYTKEETNKITKPLLKYGVMWSVSDYNDLGNRCFDSVGLKANPGIGSQGGSSDFDNIYPWSEIKRCNIKVNSANAKIVTFEGESGFSLDGSNGEVFVRIPKFYAERYTKDGYEYVTVSANGVTPHAAFIEDGKELDEIFISAFEGSLENGKLHSIAGKMPLNNVLPSELLGYAKENGDGFSLYDSRCVDLIWTLFAVEYACRNTNNILGYGLSDFWQGVAGGKGNCIENATNTNSIKVGYWNDAYKLYIPIGSNALICNGSQTNIIKYGKITSITDAADKSYTIFTFDGEPFNVDTNCFIGTAPYDTNLCESATEPLIYHTGRALNVRGSGDVNETRNPIRYRWIENIFGNCWHYLPDITFVDRQMYVCRNMRAYEFHKHEGQYKAVCNPFIKQSSNGSKQDNPNANYWLSALVNDVFAKGVSMGTGYNMSLTSKQGFGGYYYMNDGVMCIANGGGFDHLYRCNILTNRAWIPSTDKWYLYGGRLMFKNID